VLGINRRKNQREKNQRENSLDKIGSRKRTGCQRLILPAYHDWLS